MTAYLIRHARAANRGEWEGDDRLRPLIKAGRQQAEALARMFENHRVDKILSSGYVRCVQTVEPLAAARKLPLEITTDLEEGGAGEGVLRLVERFAGRQLVGCTHGDVMEDLLQILIERGIISGARLANEKGGTWVLEEERGRVTGATYWRAP